VNSLLWGVQIFLALFFLAAGAPKILGRGMERWTGFAEMPRAQVVMIGVSEVLGAMGLVLPMALGIAPWLTPLAAVGLAVIVLMATGFHLRADERLNALETALWASIAAGIAMGRWGVVAGIGGVPTGVLVVGLVVLAAAAIVNVVVLLRRPVNDVAISE
jgi:hypothetical protein